MVAPDKGSESVSVRGWTYLNWETERDENVARFVKWQQRRNGSVDDDDGEVYVYREWGQNENEWGIFRKKSLICGNMRGFMVIIFLVDF